MGGSYVHARTRVDFGPCLVQAYRCSKGIRLADFVERKMCAALESSVHIIKG
jgi:hypothetical protein